MKKIILAALGAILACSAASAADLPRNVYKAPLVAAPYFSWTGFYAGVNVGYGFNDTSGTIGLLGGPSGGLTGSGDGILGGAQIGYNWQFNQFVFGIEADFQGSDGRGNVTGVSGARTLTGTASNPYFGTVRGRLGYAFDRTMIYATGGLLYGRSELSGVVTGLGGGTFSSSADFTTYTVGGGIEHALWDRWSVKAEYLYAGTPDKVPLPTNFVSGATGNIDNHIVRAGVNYRFW